MLGVEREDGEGGRRVRDKGEKEYDKRAVVGSWFRV